jgi:hypothetical protein
MTNRKEPVERRKHKRFQVGYGAFVILKSYDNKMARIVDINTDGLSFTYHPTVEESVMPTELDILVADSALHLYGIPCKTISNFADYENPFADISRRRCGVEFEELTHGEIFLLEHIIKNHTIGEA